MVRYNIYILFMRLSMEFHKHFNGKSPNKYYEEINWGLMSTGGCKPNV